MSDHSYAPEFCSICDPSYHTYACMVSPPKKTTIEFEDE